jgi:two-component system OmpR family response regulator
MVDDDVRLLSMLKRALTAEGSYTVRTEDNALRAAATAREFRPDLIILDVSMPGMDGGEVAMALRKEPLTKETPIIFLTSLVTDQEVAAHHGTIGGEHYLAKPVDPEELCRKVGSFFGK